MLLSHQLEVPHVAVYGVNVMEKMNGHSALAVWQWLALRGLDWTFLYFRISAGKDCARIVPGKAIAKGTVSINSIDTKIPVWGPFSASCIDDERVCKPLRLYPERGFHASLSPGDTKERLKVELQTPTHPNMVGYRPLSKREIDLWYPELLMEVPHHPEIPAAVRRFVDSILLGPQI